MIKSNLPYLLKEALDTGAWELTEQTTNTESFTRGSERIMIGTRALRGTTPPSYVYEYVDNDRRIRRQTMTVINSLCAMVAKSGQLFTEDDNVSTTTE